MGAGRRPLARTDRAILTLVDGLADGDEEELIIGELAHKLASALRDLRGYVPDQVWWDSGAAGALIEYQARRGR